MTHNFDDALALESLGDGKYRGRTSAPFNNMVGPFGGLTAALLVRAVELHPDRHGDPLTVTVNFAGPIAEGDFEISTRAVRTNRSNQHWYLELHQNGTIATTATAVFGTRRDTWDSDEAVRPDVPGPDGIDPIDFPTMIAWAANYEMRYLAGALTETEAVDSVGQVWIRDRPPRPLDFASLTSLSDTFYPRVFQRRGKYLSAGTISLTVHFFATAEDLAAQGDDFLLATAHARRFHRGYHDQTAELWSTAGTLLATGHQLVYYKD
ncbi:acyl-CoA thioesterase [Rhodococcoides trifolii]|uniref:Acyl-CoA thioesterase n=1 Tax=Rhodococcoides trifolii TaxID=908250 RepID=A0A917CVH8_9NOCA|nr:thioesterase family protein [Rhodococcus trifolii]GGF99661.1 acyl-CoA thioesterase [Rhodococcus trifolii]